MYEVIRIAIVDDEPMILEMVEKKLKSMEVSIDAYDKAETVLEQLEHGTEYDIILSDIAMKGMQGIEFGEIVRRKYPKIFLLFLTSYEGYAMQSYQINAYQYILKKEIDSRLPEIMQELIQRIQIERQQYRILKNNNEITKIYYKDIVYIKKIKGAKYVQYCTMDGEYRERIALDKLIQEIDAPSFLWIERSYIVNIKHIVRMNGNIIFLDNGAEMTVSKAKILEVKKQISSQWRW